MVRKRRIAKAFASTIVAFIGSFPFDGSCDAFTGGSNLNIFHRNQQPLRRQEQQRPLYSQKNYYARKFRDRTSPSQQRQQHNDNNKSHNPTRELERRIVSLGRKGLTDEALQLFYDSATGKSKNSNMQDVNIRLVNAAIDACGRARPVRIETALQLLETYKDHANVYTFGPLLGALARLNRVKDARGWIKRMQTSEYNNVEPNAVIYQSAIHAASRAANLPVALELLQEAQDDNILLTIVGYNAALSAANRAGDADAALEIFHRLTPSNMAADDDASSETTRNDHINLPSPDAVTYGTLLGALETAGRWTDVLRYARTMQQPHLNIPLDGLATTSILHACQQLGLAQEARYYLQKAVSNNEVEYRRTTAGKQTAHALRPLRGADGVAYTLAISACARGGAWQQAITTLDEYLETVNECSTTESSSSSSCKSAKASFYNNTSTVAAFTAAMTGCEYAGEWKEAFRLLGRMRQLGVTPNEGTFTAILGACATACARQQQQPGAPMMMNDNSSDGSLPPSPDAQLKALQLFGILQKDPTLCRPNVQIYNAAIRVCAEALDVPRAFRLLDLLTSSNNSKENRRLRPNVVTFGSLMTAAERVRDVDAVSQVFQRMRQHDVNPNEIIYGAAISACRKAQHEDRCFRLLQKMRQEGLMPNTATYNTVLVAQVERRQLERAKQVFQMLLQQQHEQQQDNPENSRAVAPTRQSYSILIRGFLNHDQPNQAEIVLRRMWEQRIVPDVELLTSTVASYERLGQPRQALQLMESMREQGYDFYESSLLNVAFKQGVKVMTKVERGLLGGSSASSSTSAIPEKILDDSTPSFEGKRIVIPPLLNATDDLPDAVKA